MGHASSPRVAPAPVTPPVQRSDSSSWMQQVGPEGLTDSTVAGEEGLGRCNGVGFVIGMKAGCAAWRRGDAGISAFWPVSRRLLTTLQGFK